MSKTIEIDGIEVELDDDVDPAELEFGADSREDANIDWDEVEAAGEDDSQEEDD